MNDVEVRSSLAWRRSGELLYGGLLLAAAAFLVLLGFQLLRLGGSAYYVLSGLLLGASSLALLLGHWWFGQRVYLAYVLGTLAWALWEVGLDPWPLLPRVAGGPVLLGIPFLLMWVRCRRVRLIIVAGALIGAVAVGALLRPHVLKPVNVGRSSDVANTGRVNMGRQGEWRNFANTLDGTRYSPLTLINRSNVGGLSVQWKTFVALPDGPPFRFESVPLKVNQRLYFCTPFSDVYALNAETGQILWRFEAHPDLHHVTVGVCRGVAFYTVPNATGACAQRVYTSTVDARLIALDAETGQRCRQFGIDGEVDLTVQIGQSVPGYYYPTSAPTIVRGRIIIGGLVADNQTTDSPSGVVRAFDAVTGGLAWAWDVEHPDNQGAPPDDETYGKDTPNAWGPMSADEQLGLVFVPTGNATPDYWGGHRSRQSNAYASSIVALDIDSGRLRWSFQTTHYDLWDYDVGSQPVLTDLVINGIRRLAVVQPTKRGELFVLDRRTGQPIFPVIEQTAPTSGSAEHIAATQPHSVAMPYFGGAKLLEKDMWGLTPFDQLWCRLRFREARYEGSLTPPGLTPSIADPGYIGGMDWGSTAIDSHEQIAIVTSNRIVNYVRLMTREEAERRHLKPSVGEGVNFGGDAPQAGTPYAVSVTPFLSPLQVPCQRPPYGLISAVDLSVGKLLWDHPFGVARDLGPLGIRSLLPWTIGTPLIGGPMTTAAGLTFSGGTQDRKFRAFETSSGRLLWESDLPMSAQGVPMSYFSTTSQRQFIALAAGDGTRGRDGKRWVGIVAFSLPSQSRPTTAVTNGLFQP